MSDNQHEPVNAFKALVGSKSFEVILDILKSIGRDSRTERMSVVIAGILRYALTMAREDPASGGVSEALINIEEDPYSEDEKYRDVVLELIDEICKEAKIVNFRTSAGGSDYSIAEEVLSEFCRWYNMPWEQ